MIVLSLFDGISCGQIALKKSGIKVDRYYASEIDKYAIKVTQSNFPNTIQLGDVSKVSYKDGFLYTEKGNFEVGKIDIILAGSPCQGFSFAGKQLNFEDPRSKLFFEFERILREVNPKYFLLENVKMKKESEDVISKYLGVKPIEINSALLSAQNRKRLYWTNIPNVTQPKDKGICVTEILERHGYISAIRGRYVEDGKTKQFVEFRKDNKTNTLTTVKKDNVVVDNYFEGKLLAKDVEYRYLTPLECERLQTLPENYTAHVSSSQRLKTIGNCWTVDVIVHILKGLEQ